MTPALALQSDVFSGYVYLISGLIGGAGLLLAVLKWVFKRNTQSAWIIYRGWLIMAPLILGCLFAGRTTTIIFLTLVAIFGFKEFARATGLYQDWWMTGSVYIAIVAVGFFTLMYDPFTGKAGWLGTFLALPVYAITFFLIIPIVRNQYKGQLQIAALAIVGFVYIGWMFGHLGFLANSNRPYGYLLYLIVAVELNDIAAYTFGKLFGKHSLRSNISPNKTWEGALGALGFSMMLPWLLAFALPHFGFWQRLLTGLIVGVGGQLGDLTISFIKRDLGIKDMGNALAGHGGLLDRIDSLIYTAPLFFHLVNYYFDIR